MRDDKFPRPVVFCALLIGIVALWFRMWKLSTVPALNGDEAWFGIEVLHFLRGEPVLWRTPPGNPLNPFWCVPLLALHKVFEPSFVLLRSVAVVSGFLALFVNFCLCKRVFDKATAWFSTLLLAVLPINIAYSRFATDPAQILLFSLPLLYLPLWALREPDKSKRLFALSGLLLFAAVFVHPTNIFCAVWLLVGVIWHFGGRKFLLWLRRSAVENPVENPVEKPVRASLLSRPQLLILCLVTLLVGALATQIESSQGEGPLLGPLNPERLILFVRGVQRLFSGVTIYRYIAGSYDFGHDEVNWQADKKLAPASLSDWGWPDALGLLCALILVGALARRVWQAARQASSEGNSHCDLVLLCCFVAAGLPFYWGVGHLALQPGQERYALWMIAPGTLVMARGYYALWQSARSAPQNPRARWRETLVLSGGLGLASLCLGSFYNGYFEYFAQSGGTGQFTFRTAQEEPKLSALREVLAWQEQQRPATRVWILTAEWWNYQPLRYLAFQHPDVTIVPQDAWSLRMEARRKAAYAGSPYYRQAKSSAYETALKSGQVWFIGFAGSRDTILFLQKLKARGLAFQQSVRADNGGKPLMLVVHILAQKK